MNVKPIVRLFFLVLIVLIQFFLVITYTNTLASKNVALTNLQRDISQENRSQGDYRETIALSLNETIVTESRKESIKRISPDETIKLRDLQPSIPDPKDPNAPPPSTTNSIIAF